MMVVFKCKMCGGNLEIKEGQTVCTCDFCGSTQTVPNADSEKKINLFNRANNLRIKNEFDKAIAAYQSIISEFPDDGEAHWGMCLCKYGIEYVDDPRTGEKVPTCHRTLFDSILDDEDFKLAVKNADEVAKDVYLAEAKEIDRLQKHIIKVSQKEEPYDIFICYKETDVSGKRTSDSVIAHDIYDKLIENGYKVFFARITLEGKLGQEYEPLIFAALRSAKVMLVIGSNADYFNAVWVKNEWSRFLSFMKDDKEKYLIPCFKDIDAYDMPEEFLPFQSQDLGKLGYLQDLSRGIDKIFNRDKTKKTSTASTNEAIEKHFERLDKALEESKFDKAEWILDEIFVLNPKLSKAYLYNILIKRGYSSVKDFELSTEMLENDEDYKKALEYADQEYKEKLTSYDNAIKRNIYDNAIALIESERYVEAKRIFEELGDYKDSATQAKNMECEIILASKSLISSAIQKLDKSSFDIEIGKLQSIKYNKDVPDLIKKFEKEFNDKLKNYGELKYQRAIDNFNKHYFKEAKIIFEELGDYKDSAIQAKNMDCEEILFASKSIISSAILNLNKSSFDVGIEKLQSINYYKDVPDQIKKFEKEFNDKMLTVRKLRKRSNLITFIILCTVALLVVFFILLSIFL